MSNGPVIGRQPDRNLAGIPVYISMQHRYKFQFRRTTNIKPRSFAVVHLSVYPSFLYVGLCEAEVSSTAIAPGDIRSSMKTSLMRLLITFAPTGTYVLDQRTTPEVDNISNVSNMAMMVVFWWTHNDEGA